MARTFELEHPVGRDEELALADDLLRATLADASDADPHVRALLVGGDAGIGKTTLVHALGARAVRDTIVDVIDEVIREHGAEQLVILGAGLDARAWRMPELSRRHGVRGGPLRVAAGQVAPDPRPHADGPAGPSRGDRPRDPGP